MKHATLLHTLMSVLCQCLTKITGKGYNQLSSSRAKAWVRVPVAADYCDAHLTGSNWPYS